jgi:hypothetical protein
MGRHGDEEPGFDQLRDVRRSLNRKVSASALAGLDGDEPARWIVESQDHDIATASGRARSNVKSILRSPAKVPNDDTESNRKVRGARR